MRKLAAVIISAAYGKIRVYEGFTIAGQYWAITGGCGVMPLDAPFRLGQFLVDEHGRLVPGTPEATPTLYLQWRGLTVCVRMARVNPDQDDGRLAMTAMIGRVPSTASDPAGSAVRRGQTLAKLRDLSAAMGDGWQLTLLPDHRANIESARGIALPASAQALLTEVTCFLLGLAPYLDLLSESDIDMEAAGKPSIGGTANT